MTISTKKALDHLDAKGFINGWKFQNVDASFEEDGSMIEKSIIIYNEEQVNVSNEVYGKKAILYFTAKDPETAQRIANELKSIGGSPSFRWCPTRPEKFDMQVSYFKGHRWWE